MCSESVEYDKFLTSFRGDPVGILKTYLIIRLINRLKTWSVSVWWFFIIKLYQKCIIVRVMEFQFFIVIVDFIAEFIYYL